MGEHATKGLEHWLMTKTGKDIYFWNFLVLMFFTLFEVGAVFFEKIPGTEIKITKMGSHLVSDLFAGNQQKSSHFQKFVKMAPMGVPGSKRHPKGIQKASKRIPKGVQKA